MKVIILEDDRVENVSDGYARNYLLPRKLAVAATPAALSAVENRKEQKKAELEKKRAEAQAVADKLNQAEIEIKVDAGEGGKLFGSVTTSDISDILKKETGVEIDKRKIELAEPIKMIGDYTALVKLFLEINAHPKIKVVPK